MAANSSTIFSKRVALLLVIGLGIWLTLLWGNPRPPSEVQQVAQALTQSGKLLFEQAIESSLEFGWKSVVAAAPLFAIYAIFGIGELQTSAISLIALSVSTFLCYEIVRGVANEKLALLSALAWATSPLLITLTPEFPYPYLAEFLSFGAIYSVILFRTQKIRRLFWGLLLAIATAIYMSIYLWGLWLPMFLIVYLSLETLGRKRIAYVLIVTILAWLLLGTYALNTHEIDFYNTATPVRSVLLAPMAEVEGVSALRPNVQFLIEGNTPAIVIVIIGAVLASTRGSQVFRFGGLAIAICLTFNFWFDLAGIDGAISPIILPLSLFTAYFFKDLNRVPFFVSLAAVFFGMFAFLLNLEPVSKYLELPNIEGGWATETFLFGLSRILAGLLPLLALLSIYILPKIGKRQQLAMVLIFLVLGVVQIGLMPVL